MDPTRLLLHLSQAAQASSIAIEVTSLWEVAKGVLLAICTAGALYTVRTQFWLRDTVREILIEIRGVDGTNGMKSKVLAHEERLRLIDDRHIAIDAVAEAERLHYQGEDRRRGPRRAQDVVTGMIVDETINPRRGE